MRTGSQRGADQPGTKRQKTARGTGAGLTEELGDERAQAATRQLCLPAVGDTSAPVAGAPWRCCGLDEVGRGALAGPLVAAGAILPEDIHARLGPLARFLRDSKTVPPARRIDLAARLREHALALRIVVIPVTEINARGIGWANREAFRRLIGLLHADEYVVDGRVRPPAPPERAGRVRCLVRADALVPAVSAAALVAKVHRDTLMAALHERHPAFGWATNMGYGTASHLAALRAQGPCAEHRTVFVATALGHAPRSAAAGARGEAPILALLTEE
jgi:ribonuclease HII